MTDTTTETEVDVKRLADQIMGVPTDDGLNLDRFERALRETRLKSGDPEQEAIEADREHIHKLADRIARGY